MFFGNLTNIEIAALIASGLPSYYDTVYSTDWKEILRYNGVVFESICTCSYIGTYPPCSSESAVTGCPSVLEAYGTFIPE